MCTIQFLGHSLLNSSTINMSNVRWFQLGYCMYKLEHIIAENISLSNRHSLLEALHIVKDIKNKVENRSVTLEEVYTLWNRAYNLYKGDKNSSDDDTNDSM